MAGNLFWYSGGDMLVAYHGKAIGLMQAVSSSLPGSQAVIAIANFIVTACIGIATVNNSVQLQPIVA